MSVDTLLEQGPHVGGLPQVGDAAVGPRHVDHMEHREQHLVAGRLDHRRVDAVGAWRTERAQRTDLGLELV